MKTAVVADTEDQPQEIVDGPGSRLRQARLAKGLDISRLAAQLHLNDAMIEAIERDDYDRLPGPVFVRGYLKHYARLVGMDSKALVETYDRMLPGDGAAPLLPNATGVKMELGSSHLLMRLMTWLAILLLLALLLIWAQGRLEWLGTTLLPLPSTQENALPEEPPGQGSNLAPRPVQIPSSAPPDDRGAFEQPASGEPAGEQGMGAEMPAAGPAQERERPKEPLAVDSSMVASSLSEPAASADRRSEMPPETGVDEQIRTPTAEPAALAPVAEPTPAAGQSTIEFIFSDSCWLDVRDASGRNKIIGVMARGSRRRLTGEPPFTVVLGNTHAVEVRLDGRPFDVTRYTRGKVARFSVDPGDLPQ